MPSQNDINDVAGRTVRITGGQTTTPEISLVGRILCGLLMPAAFTGTTLTFQTAEYDGGTYRTLNKAGSDLSVTVAANKYIILDPSDFSGVRWLKIISGSTEGGNRDIILQTIVV